MDFLELVTGARTCRRFREAEGMPAGMLDWLIECARVTPCGGNAQALRFAVAESPEACAAVFPALKWAGMLTDWDGPEAGERPTGYVAILGEAGTRAKLNAIDAGIAAQTIQLAAYTRDLGCCIFLSFDPRKIREVLGIPENLEPLLVLALGFQKEVRRVETVGADGSVKYWRDAQGVHHVPKRPLEDRSFCTSSRKSASASASSLTPALSISASTGISGSSSVFMSSTRCAPDSRLSSWSVMVRARRPGLAAESPSAVPQRADSLGQP